MKRFISMFAGVAIGFGILSAYAAQDTAIDNVEVRDPIRLEAYLEANASDAQSRLAALEVSLGTNTTTLVTVGALTTTGRTTTVGFTLATKVCSLATLTNLVYNNGATTGNVNIVTWAP